MSEIKRLQWVSERIIFFSSLFHFIWILCEHLLNWEDFLFGTSACASANKIELEYECVLCFFPVVVTSPLYVLVRNETVVSLAGYPKCSKIYSLCDATAFIQTIKILYSVSDMPKKATKREKQGKTIDKNHRIIWKQKAERLFNFVKK